MPGLHLGAHLRDPELDRLVLREVLRASEEALPMPEHLVGVDLP